MRNIKLTLEYDGSGFCGWQFQPAQRSVQGEVETALQQLTRETIRTTAAGRTDAGVHALGQVINFHTASAHALNVFVKGGNALLPPDVRILDAAEVDEHFSARYSATSRHYFYRISNRPRAIARHYCWYLPLQLDLSAMQQAVKVLRGEIDFESFCQAGSGLDHFRCNVVHAEWHQEQDELVFDICANRFVHNMVRILAGTCVEIGRGALPADAMSSILEARDRRAAGRTAPAHGLTLVKVGYPE